MTPTFLALAVASALLQTPVLAASAPKYLFTLLVPGDITTAVGS